MKEGSRLGVSENNKSFDPNVHLIWIKTKFQSVEGIFLFCLPLPTRLVIQIVFFFLFILAQLKASCSVVKRVVL